MTDTQILMLIISALGVAVLYLLALVTAWRRTAHQEHLRAAAAHLREKKLQRQLDEHNPWHNRGQAPASPWGRR